MSVQVERSDWLAEARAQSRQLADVRAGIAGSSWDGLVSRHATGDRIRARSVATLIAAALLTIVPGAWAWVRHVRVVPAMLTGSSTVEAPIEGRIATDRRIIPAAGARRRKRTPEPAPAPVPTAEPATGEYIEPDGEMIFVRPRVQQAPLFDTQEYKSRGVLVHD